jgi:hypothetical protein
MNIHDQKTNSDSAEKVNNNSNKTGAKTSKSGFMGKLGELVRKAVDCCLE